VSGRFFDHLMVQLDDRLAENLEDCGPSLREMVVPAPSLALPYCGFGPEPAVSFQSLQ
jgi:hypothetical protein